MQAEGHRSHGNIWTSFLLPRLSVVQPSASSIVVERHVFKWQEAELYMVGFCFFFFYCVTAFQPLSRTELRTHPDTTDSSSLILRSVPRSLSPPCVSIQARGHCSGLFSVAQKRAAARIPEPCCMWWNSVWKHGKKEKKKKKSCVIAFDLTGAHGVRGPYTQAVHRAVIKCLVWIVFHLFRAAYRMKTNSRWILTLS